MDDQTKKQNEQDGLFYPFYNPIGRYFPDEGVIFKKAQKEDEYLFEYKEGSRTLLNIGGETICLIPKNILIPGDLDLYHELLKELRNYEPRKTISKQQQKRRRGY